MNLDQLSSPLPKPWLNIACDTLTCRQLIVDPVPGFSDAFSYYSNLGGGLSIPALTSIGGLCQTVEIATEFYRAGDVYESDRDLNIQVSISLQVSSALAQEMRFRLGFLVAGLPVAWQTNTYLITGVGANSAQYITATALIALPAGTTLSWRFSNDSAGILAVNTCRFSGFPVS